MQNKHKKTDKTGISIVKADVEKADKPSTGTGTGRADIEEVNKPGINKGRVHIKEIDKPGTSIAMENLEIEDNPRKLTTERQLAIRQVAAQMSLFFSIKSYV